VTDEPRMTRRRAVILMGAMLGASAVLWTAIGSVGVATGQEETDKPMVIARAHAGQHAPAFTEPVFVLVVGGDARTGVGGLYDSIHIVALDPVKRRASIVGIPRDSYVQSAHGNGMNKINSHGAAEGLPGFLDTVEQLSGCEFDYYMITSFEGFRGPQTGSGASFDKGPGLIDDLGGITIHVPDPLPNPNPIPLDAGTYRVGGRGALSYVRNRYNRPGGDFDRSLAQGEFLKFVLAEMRADYEADPTTAIRNIAAARRHIRMDIPVTEAFRLGLVALRIKPKNVRNEVLDGTTATVNGASIVRITQGGLNQLTDICSDGRLGG